VCVFGKRGPFVPGTLSIPWGTANSEGNGLFHEPTDKQKKTGKEGRKIRGEDVGKEYWAHD